MRIGTSYAAIWRVSAPLMIGSAAQSLIALTDSVFLYYLSEADFASIGFVSTFYLIVAAVGFGFSRGGQIMIARRAGERRPEEVGRVWFAMLYFEVALALVMFLLLTYGTYWLFALNVDSEVIFYKSLAYIDMRRWGVFAAYIGVAMIALYTGIARPVFIVLDTLVLAGVNIALDYALIFGHWGFPAMGIAGAGLASTLAEYVALIVFVIYMLLDRANRVYRVFHIPKIDIALIRQQVKLAVPMVAQALVGLGSAFIFLGLVENFGERALAITNLARVVYLILSIPCWGFSTGTNTIISNYIGQRRRQAVLPMLWKIAVLCLGVTVVITLPVVIFPHELLYPLLGSDRASLVDAAEPVLWVVGAIMFAFAVSSIFFNGLIGAGATAYALRLQMVCAVGYVILTYLVVNLPGGNLALAWTTEIAYWLAVFVMSYRYMRSRRWHKLQM